MAKRPGIPKPPPPRLATSPLTVREIQAAQPSAQRRRLWEPGGLVLEILPSGNKVWRHRYVKDGKQIWHTFGAFPVVSLADARQRLADLKRDLSQGKNPRLELRAAKAANANTFEAIAREWLDIQAAQTNAKTASNRQTRLERLVFPALGDAPISSIRPDVALAALRRIEARGTIHTARRMLQDCVAIGDYAVTTGVLNANPFLSLRKALKAEQPRHFSAIIEPLRFGELLRAMDGYDGDVITRYALQLAALFFVRSSELRTMRWEAVDFAAKQWALVATEKKEKRPHIVPLNRQALAILRELKAITGNGEYVLGSRMGGRPLSENTLNAALRRLGIAKEEHSTHGFRATARTLLDEALHFPADIIEHQLAHNVRDALGRAYNRTTKLPERAAMMQAWGDYLDRLRTGNTAASQELT